MNFEQRVKEFEKYKENKNIPSFEEEYWDENNVIFISCSHSARHLRNGKVKSERGESHTAIVAKDIAYLLNKKYKKNKVAIMYKTNNEEDDPNYNERSEYREALEKKLKGKRGILIDFHTMKNDRKIDIEIGTDYGNNIKKDDVLLNRMVENFKKNNIKVVVDEKFTASKETTVTKYISNKEENIKAIQVEMNWENYISADNYTNLLHGLVSVIKEEIENLNKE